MPRTQKLYFCEKIKPDKDGFRERMWLDNPCKGWRVLKTAPVDDRQGEGLIFSLPHHSNVFSGRRVFF